MKRKIYLNETQLISIIKNTAARIINENIDDEWGGNCHDPKDTHFAVNKQTNLIVFSWDYSEYDPADLRSDKKYYFMDDIRENGYNPTEYKILTKRGCAKQGINPDISSSWSNDGITPIGA